MLLAVADFKYGLRFLVWVLDAYFPGGLHRVEVVDETVRHALNSLAFVAPDWLRSVSPPIWLERYTRRARDVRLPTGAEEREALAVKPTENLQAYDLYLRATDRWRRWDKEDFAAGMDRLAASA